MEIFHAIQKPEVFQSTSLPSCDGDGALGCYRVPGDAAKHNLAVAAADADATAARDGADLLLQVAGVDRDLHVEHADPRLTARLEALQGLSLPGALIRFSGGGGRRWVVRVRHPALAVAVAGIVAAAALHLVAAPSLFRWLMPLPDTLKIAVSLVLIAPLAFFMGLPLPLALVRVAAARPGLVPLAWGITVVPPC
jgi:hypothetical protein